MPLLSLLKRPKLLWAYILTAVEIARRHGVLAVCKKTFRFLSRQKNVFQYSHWVRALEPFRQKRNRVLLERVIDGPLISILMPVCDPDPRFLREAIQSVQDQIYLRWELCIADDASTRAEVRKVLEEAQEDSRIKVIFREARGHISNATNSSLELARGVLVGFLDHDDRLAPEALLEVAAVYQEKQETDLFYSDEDKIDESGKRYSPHFKPGFNLGLLYGHNYICHFLVLRRSLLVEIGGLRAGFEGSQDYDLVLRAVEKTRNIRHLPFVLYHWRAIPGSTAMAESEKDYCYDALQRSLKDHLNRTYPQAVVEQGVRTTNRVKYPRKAPKVSIIIPTRDKALLLKKLLEGLLEKTAYPLFEVLVVDNRSEEPETLKYFEGLKTNPQVRILAHPEAFHFSKINNRAAEKAEGEILLFLNNDMEVLDPEWLQELISYFSDPSVGAVGAKLLYPSLRLQHGGVVLGLGEGAVASHPFIGSSRDGEGYFRRLWCTHDVSAVTGACLATRATIFHRVQGFEENGLEVAYSDVDYCLKVGKLGYRVLWTPWVELIHHESASRGYDVADPVKLSRLRTEQKWMRKTWGELLTSDPSYNPNLSLNSPSFDLVFPPRHIESL